MRSDSIASYPMKSISLLSVLSIAALLIPAASAQSPWQAAEQRAQGTLGLYAIHMESGRTWEWNADQNFPMMSVFKYPIAIRVLQLVDAEKLSLAKKIEVTSADLSPGYSPIREQHPQGGGSYSIEELLELMVRSSDNTACDILVREAGGPEAITATLRKLGVTGIHVSMDEKTMNAEYDRTGPTAFAATGKNAAVPKEMGRLLVLTQQHKIGLTEASQEKLIHWMTVTTTGPKRLKAGLPPGTPFYHKTGLSQRTKGLQMATNDVGVFTLPDHTHVAISTFMKLAKGSEDDIEAALAGVAARIYQEAASGVK